MRQGEIVYSPLYRKQILLLQPHFQKDAVRFNLQVSEDKPPETFAEKLRYARYQKGLLQREVAEMVGVSRTCYAEWENGGTVSEEMMGKLGSFYGNALEIKL